MKSCTAPAQVLKNVWKKTPHPSFNIVPSPVKFLEGRCRISDRRPSWQNYLTDPPPILNPGAGGLTASAVPVQDFRRQQYSRGCVFLSAARPNRYPKLLKQCLVIARAGCSLRCPRSVPQASNTKVNAAKMESMRLAYRFTFFRPNWYPKLLNPW